MKYELKMSQEKKKLLYHDQQYPIQDLSYFIQHFIHCPPSPAIKNPKLFIFLSLTRH